MIESDERDPGMFDTYLQAALTIVLCVLLSCAIVAFCLIAWTTIN